MRPVAARYADINRRAAEAALAST
ncbi:binfunctional sulfate adenylyltransferase subunit 1/adenylylsulfate kinase protein [Roseovarius sp. 217]|nr:binfunctional sulfate adenylyltransferase subunit 1/adenylylsulfate kinase protein [Roseovarius sp. 217]